MWSFSNSKVYSVFIISNFLAPYAATVCTDKLSGFACSLLGNQKNNSR